MCTSSPSPEMLYFKDHIRFVHRSSTDYTIPLLKYYQVRALAGGYKRDHSRYRTVSSIPENKLLEGKCAEKFEGKECCHFVENKKYF